jgi:4-amino-4-deoxy-L-arabinose transferase-like glycosyltransferase
VPVSKRGFALWLTAIAAAGFVVRIAFVVLSRVQHLPLGLGDSAYYSRGANLLADGRGFIDPFLLPAVRQSADHPPLYTLWLAIPSLVWPGHVATPTVHMVWSCVLGAGTVAVCGLAGRAIAGARVGLIAAVLAAIYPNLWVHDGMLLSETAAIFTTAVLILFAYRFLDAPSGWRAAWLGLWCGLAGLARPELVLALPLVLAPLVLLRRDRSWKQRLLWLAAGTLATLVCIAPWLGDNRSRFDRPVYMSDNFGSTLAAANCQATYYGPDLGYKNYDCARVLAAQFARTVPHWSTLDESERDFVFRKAAVDYIKDHESRVPYEVAVRWARIAGLYHPTQEIHDNVFLLDQPVWLGNLLLFSYYAMVLLAIAGAVVLYRRRLPIWPLVAIVVIVLASVAVTFAQVRYRAPAEVAFVLAGAVAVDAAFRRVGRGRHSGDPPATRQLEVADAPT